MQLYQVVFFETKTSKPVEDFLFRLDVKISSKAFKAFNLLKTYGIYIGPQFVKKIRADLFELRIRSQVQVRLLFTIRNNRIIILHGFIKKTNKIPGREISTAIKRLTYI